MDCVLEVRNICKVFPGVKALDNISLKIHKGEVLCIAGENGAGKSTLIKVLSGLYIPDGGEIFVNGEEQHFKNPQDALKCGISVVYQEHKLIDNLTVAENIYFGRFPMTKANTIDYKTLYAQTDVIIKKLGLTINAKDKVEKLTSSQSQMVEIAKAYSRDAQLMILDEPSSSITDSEIPILHGIINNLKKQGKSFIYVSHKMKEMFVIGDTVAVFKDGALVGVKPASELDVDKVVAMMVGRDIGQVYEPKDREVGEEVLRVEGLSNNMVNDISFHINKGEIVGFAGLVGAGRSETAESIFGYRKKTAGKVFVKGKEVNIKKPKDAIANGIGFITEDRKKTGAIQVKSVGLNITFCTLKKFCKRGIIRFAKEKVVIDKYIKELEIKTPTARQEVQYLSGGNQQKVILAKWLLTNSDLLICDEPTKGIDVGTKQEFYKILDGLARQGYAIMLISSELPEIIGLSNRIYVMQEGKLSAEITDESQMTEEIIAGYAMK